MMLLSPNYIKYSKIHRKNNFKKIIFKNNKLEYGLYGLQLIKSTLMHFHQIEAIRLSIVRITKRKGKLWIRFFPNIPITKKPKEVRMGKGVGAFSHWVCRLSKYTILIELDNISLKLAKEALFTSGKKLPIKNKIIKNKFILKEE